MDRMDRLAKERRARLAAERLLEQKSRELFAANEKLALHARALSDQIVEQRQAVRSAQSEAETLKDQNLRFLSDLERAHTTAVMAERRLWDSINTIRDGFAVFDSTNRLVAANEAFRTLLECEDLSPGASYAETLRLIVDNGVVDPGDDGADAWCRRMAARWDADPIEPVVVALTSGVWLRLIDRRARDGDMVCLAVDITEEMRIWAAIEAIPDGFVLFDREDRLMVCNQRYRDLYPESAEAIMPGATFEAILRHGLKNGQYPDAMGREDEWMENRLNMRHDRSVEFEHPVAGNRWLRVIDQETPDGGRVGLRVDVTALREQNAALEAARLAAEAAVRAKSAFLANMSHEIRTPMNGVVGMAELLCDTPLTDEQRLFAETIRSSGEALLVIINDILDYSKIEAERLTLRPEPFDLERVIHEVAMLLQPRARAKGIDVMIDFDIFLPTRYVGDPGRLRQVLTNLMGNAVKFTDSGHVLIRVVGVETAERMQQLHITVEDTGIGIAAEHLDHIFGEFNQVDSASNRRFEGTGLGLAITQRIVEHMGGAVWVDSEPGRGSCFGFRLALPVAENADDIPTPVSLKRALVVDDQFINRTVLERQLATCGMKSVLCRSAADALTVLQQDRDFDVILIDHEMPEIDGLHLAQAIREAGLKVPILLLSSNAATAMAAQQTGLVAAILAKPLLRADLYRRLQALSAPVAVVPPAPSGQARQLRVLAAEDNRTNQLVFRKMVKDLDMDLQFASNGHEAVEMFQTFKPDMVFMDISMPIMDGREAARAIRALEGGAAHVPIIALTAHAMAGDAASIRAAGIDHIMTKPLRRGAICDMLTSCTPAGVRPPLAAPQAETVAG